MTEAMWQHGSVTAALSMAGDRARRNRVLQRLLLGAAGLGAVWLALLIADAAVALHPAARGVLLVGVTFGVFGVAVWVLGALRAKDSVSRAARVLEATGGVSDNALVNAVQVGDSLAEGERECGDALQKALARRSAARGRAVMAGMDSEPVVERARVRHAVWGVVGVAAAWVLVGVLWPGLLGGQWARLAMPWCDMPVYSATRLTLNVSPQQPMAGGEVTARVKVGGRWPAEVALVEVDDRGGELRRWGMDADEAGDAFERRLARVVRPMRLRAEAGKAWSDVVEVLPVSPAVVDAAEAKPGGEREEAAAGVSEGAVRRDVMAELYQRLNEVLRQIERVHREAQRMAEAEGVGDQPLTPLRDLLQHAVDETAALSEAFEAVARQESNAVGREAQLLADRLRSLSVGRMTEQGPASEAADATAWAAMLRDAARADLAKMNRPVLGRGSGEGPLHGQLGTGDAESTPGEAAAAVGVTTERAAAGQGAASPDATLADRAPAAYRELAALYLDRLNRDQAKRASE